MGHKLNNCVVCGLLKDDQGRCFDCFIKHTWSISKNNGSIVTYYPDPPGSPEDAETCDVCGNFTQFFYFDHEYLRYVSDDFVIPRACSFDCFEMAALKEAV